MNLVGQHPVVHPSGAQESVAQLPEVVTGRKQKKFSNSPAGLDEHVTRVVSRPREIHRMAMLLTVQTGVTCTDSIRPKDAIVCRMIAA